MLIDVSQILAEAGGVIRLDTPLDLPAVEFMGERYSFTAPAKIKGEIFNNSKALELKAEAQLEFTARCSRCLEPVTVKQTVPINEAIVRGSEDELLSDDDDVIVMEGTAFELEDIVVSSFIMNVSGAYLCSDDCKGLCPKCGKNLNLGDCGCENTDIDPRWSGLVDIMNNTEKQ